MKPARLVLFLCVAVAFQATAAEARMRPHAACDRDTSHIETALETTAALSVLYKGVDGDLDRLRRLAKWLDQRTIVGRMQADWICKVAHACSGATGGGAPCLRAALQARARQLDHLIAHADR